MIKTNGPTKQSKVGFEVVRLGAAFIAGSLFPFGGSVMSKLFTGVFQPAGTAGSANIGKEYFLSDDGTEATLGASPQLREQLSHQGIYFEQVNDSEIRISAYDIEEANELFEQMVHDGLDNFDAIGMHDASEYADYAESLGDFGVDAWI